ncbi:MAG: fructoselysine 6-kinase [Oscillospiraceae bacterium]|nr:fructoselysine 6-kinase [Oscillospiraceae bacterium]
MKIVCIGDNCIDSYDETGKRYPGGNAVNVAVYLRCLGMESSYVGAVGNDENGELLRRTLREKGVDLSRLRVLDGPTAVSHVRMLDGDRVFGDYEEGVMAQFSPTQEDLDFFCAHHLAAATLWGHAESVLPELRHRGIPTAFDASESPLGKTARIALPHTTLFFFSDSRSGDEALHGKLRELQAMGPKLVIATRGSRGSMAFDGTEFYTVGAIPCSVVDTLGAGDSYIAGFLAAWFQRLPIPACMAAGAKNAAVTIGYSGAWR